MTTDEESPVVELPAAGDETANLLGALERNRATFAWKCGGLDAAGTGARLGPSTMTLGGLLKHLAFVEADHFLWTLHGRDPGPPWNAVDWENDEGWEWRTAADDTPEDLLALWQGSVVRARAGVRDALAERGLDTMAANSRWSETPNLRRLLVDMIEEYARHTGHADLIRESVDGLVGEDRPR